MFLVGAVLDANVIQYRVRFKMLVVLQKLLLQLLFIHGETDGSGRVVNLGMRE